MYNNIIHIYLCVFGQVSHPQNVLNHPDEVPWTGLQPHWHTRPLKQAFSRYRKRCVLHGFWVQLQLMESTLEVKRCEPVRATQILQAFLGRSQMVRCVIN